LTGAIFQGHHLPVFSKKKEVVMIDEQVPQAKIQHRPFSPPESQAQEINAFTLRQKHPLIEKCLKQLVEKGLFGRPYVQEFMYDLKRRNCRPSTIRSNFTTLMVLGMI
jgi:hypothetical protein